MSRFALVLVLTTFAACKKAAPPKAAPSDGGPAATTADTGASPDAAAAAAANVPTGLPPFGKVAGADRTKALELTSQARHAFESGEGDVDPVTAAVDAVKADPGLAEARVVLATVVEDEAFALAQLTPLTTAPAADCPDCADSVRNLRYGDWPDAVEALAAAVTPSPQRAATEALITFLGDGDAAKVSKHFTAAKVTYTRGDTKKKPGTALLTELTADVKRSIEEEIDQYVLGGDPHCAANCCGVEAHQLAHNHYFFEKVCFKPGTDEVVSLAIISGD